MRDVINTSLAVLIAAGLSLTSAVWAQKVKTPPATWTISVIGVEGGTPTIMGGFGDPMTLGSQVVYDPSVNPDVGIGIGYPDDRTAISNFFNLEIRNPAPLSERTPATTPDPARWISYRNFAMDPAGADQNWGPYTENADRLGPVAQEGGGWTWPFLALGGLVNPYEAPEYQARFLSAESHPRRYYTSAWLGVKYQGPSFLQMQQGVPLEIDPDVTVAARAKRDCLEPHAMELGLATGTPPETYTSTITRTGENTWRIDVEQPIKLIEYGTSLFTFHNKTSCKGYSAGGWWTTPVRFSLVVTRRIG